ncbi:Glycosyl transferase OS=Streptomyces antimycoticus OX=68175 GN=SSPO_079610 PE=4 SV=1 [Streptomyces antimycoticus]
MHVIGVLVVHNRYASAQRQQGRRPGGGTAARGRPPGRGVRAAQRRHRRPVPPRQGRRAPAGAVEPGGPRRARRPAARRAAGRGGRPQRLPLLCGPRCLPPARTSACPPSPRCTTTPRSARPRHARRDGPTVHRVRRIGAGPPSARSTRNSRLATVPLAVSLSVNRRRWWSGVERFFCISQPSGTSWWSGMPAERLAVKHNFVPGARHSPSRRRRACSSAARPARGGQGRAAAHDQRVGRRWRAAVWASRS